jgi:hypothetical protein
MVDDALAVSSFGSVEVGRMEERTPGTKHEGAKTCFISDDMMFSNGNVVWRRMSDVDDTVDAVDDGWWSFDLSVLGSIDLVVGRSGIIQNITHHPFLFLNSHRCCRRRKSSLSTQAMGASKSNKSKKKKGPKGKKARAKAVRYTLCLQRNVIGTSHLTLILFFHRNSLNTETRTSVGGAGL